jgi:MSHA biogenesis protein MshK
MAGRVIVFLALVALLSASAARAQLADPMRPPAGFGEKSSAAAGAAAEQGGSALRAVILRRGDKPVALVGGERVTVGSRLGDARVVAITESEIVLAGRSGRQVIRINPEVDKKMHDGAAAPSEKKKPQRRNRPAAPERESSP